MILKTRVGITQEFPQENFVKHIRELRLLTDMGLQEAKKVVDEVYEKGHMEYTPKTQKELCFFNNSHYWVLFGEPPKFASKLILPIV